MPSLCTSADCYTTDDAVDFSEVSARCAEFYPSAEKRHTIALASGSADLTETLHICVNCCRSTPNSSLCCSVVLLVDMNLTGACTDAFACNISYNSLIIQADRITLSFRGLPHPLMKMWNDPLGWSESPAPDICLESPKSHWSMDRVVAYDSQPRYRDHETDLRGFPTQRTWRYKRTRAVWTRSAQWLRMKRTSAKLLTKIVCGRRKPRS